MRFLTVLKLVSMRPPAAVTTYDAAAGGLVWMVS